MAVENQEWNWSVCGVLRWLVVALHTVNYKYIKICLHLSSGIWSLMIYKFENWSNVCQAHSTLLSVYLLFSRTKQLFLTGTTVLGPQDGRRVGMVTTTPSMT